MATQKSPNVVITERDLTSRIPSVGTNSAGTAGQFIWGPVDVITNVDNEEELARVFGKPTLTVFEDFLSCASYLSYSSGLKLVRVVGTGALNAAATASAVGAGILVKNTDHYDTISFSASTNLWVARCPGVLGNSIAVAWADTTAYNATNSSGAYTWSWRNLFTDAPASDEFHVVVYDFDGTITGTANTVLETYAFVSLTTTKKYFDGSTAYIVNKIKAASSWIYVGKESLLVGGSNGQRLGNGAEGSTVSDANRITGYQLFANTLTSDIGILFPSGAGTSASLALIGIASTRKDCIVTVSPLRADVVGVSSNTTIVSNILTTRNTYGSNDFVFMDSAYGYVYDRYNDVNRFIPLNSSTAGLIARTENSSFPWYSPAGTQRGQFNNVIKFSWSPSESDKDALYSKGINPCISLSGDGNFLYGDKTLLSRQSAFSNIGVRRLVHYIAKQVRPLARDFLFQPNDAISRARFVNTVEPFLRSIVGDRGIETFRVKCDETNNTPAVVNAQEFVADIYIIPINSVNTVYININSLSSGVDINAVVQN
jgi:hypothetical protein